MKLIIKEEELSIKLYFEERGNYVVLYAKQGLNKKALMEFYNNGSVKRSNFANIGDFKFDNEGKLIIE